MANEQNLTGDHKLTAEEARRGGIRSGEIRREKKKWRELLKEMLNEETTKGSGVTKREAITLRMLKRVNDDPKPADVKCLMEMAGEIEQMITINENKQRTAEEIRRELFGEEDGEKGE